MKKRLFEKILKEHKKILSNLDVKHKRLAICFSGVPASGKTYLAKKIEKRFKGVRFNNDEFRAEVLPGFNNEYELTKEDFDLCKEFFGSSDIEKVEKDFGYNENMLKLDSILIRYMNWMELEYPFSNGLILIDSNLGRKYRKLFSVLKEAGFELFVIRLSFDKELFLRRERVRNKDDSFYLKNIDRWKRDYENYEGRVDFEFDGDIYKLLDRIEKKLMV